MNRLSKILLFIVVILVTIIFILSFIMIKKGNDKYDTSFMNEITIKEALEIFKSDNYHVIYVGRSSCTVCEKMLPYFKNASQKLNYVTQYIDITKVDRSSSEWKEFISLLTMKSTQTLNETDDGGTLTETYGYFIDNYGFTPTIIVSKSNKQEAGFIGYKDEEELIKFLKSKGID